jgi:hypothetical protein
MRVLLLSASAHRLPVPLLGSRNRKTKNKNRRDMRPEVCCGLWGYSRTDGIDPTGKMLKPALIGGTNTGGSLGYTLLVLLR